MHIRSLATLLFLLLSSLFNASLAGTVSQDPLFLVQQAEPRVMFVMSNDHQLYVKAYTDYTDLDDDGVIDTTYTDTVDYYGYFNPSACYEYSSSRFTPVSLADAGNNGHDCSGTKWSGNFLNWASMARMDVIRKMIYGGSRSTDNASGSAHTILERVFIPDDVHAFVKVYAPAVSSEMQRFTPYSGGSVSAISMCNTSDESSGLSKNSSAAPVMRMAKGSFPDWSAMEVVQCRYDQDGGPTSGEKLSSVSYPDEMIVRVEVCNSSFLDDNCTAYPNSGSPIYKPTGLLQNYGGGSLPIRFGLMTGSYNEKISGGVLRRNVENIADEWDADTGQLLLQQTNSVAITNTLSRMRIANWDFSNNRYNDCSSPGISTSTFKSNDSQCRDWGNPLSEIYLEALRYLGQGRSGSTLSPASDFEVDDDDQIDDLKAVTWNDPYDATQWCADTSIITLSTGLNSFDTDQLATAANIGANADTLTTQVGALEGINGNQYQVGEVGTDNNQQCDTKTVGDLADVKGLCPEIPSLEGGYHIAGLAYFSRTEDLRPDITPDSGNTSSNDNIQTVTNYTVALAEALPKIEIPVPVGSNRKVSLLPHCEANSDGNASFATANWRQCSLANLSVTEMTLVNDEPVKGTLRVNWEDSTWGNDYDKDAITNLTFCVGSYCPDDGDGDSSNDPASDEIRVTVDPQGVAAGHSILLGYSLVGTKANDGVIRELILPGGCNESDLPGNSYNCSGGKGNVAPESVVYEVAASGTVPQLLENPLWYAGKYGGFNDLDGDGTPQNTDTNAPNKEWDSDGDGRPDRFYQVTNPADLVSSLNETFSDIVSRTASASAVATNSTRLDTNSKIYQARFSSVDWSGQLLAFGLDSITGAVSAVQWDAADLIPSSRSIFTTDQSGSTGVTFTSANVPNAASAYSWSSDLIDFIAGDQSNEGALFRQRSTVLGDIINSDPVFTEDESFNYYSLEIVSDTVTYANYMSGTSGSGGSRLATDKGGRQAMLYAGANDGMLHAFLGDGITTSGCNANSSACEGEEVFAYIPKAVQQNLKDLSDLNYGQAAVPHQYLVDGSPQVGDAYIDFDGSGDRWGTALIGTLGGGGKGIFALDISNPLSFTAADVLWDLDDSDLTTLDGSNTDLGYTFSEPMIVKLANGKWGVIFGNGYNSDSGKAVLYIRDLVDGSEIKTIDTETDGANGLSSPIVVDTNGDNIADYVYAGDLKGNLWKFDITNTTDVNKWKVAFKSGNTPAPLFTACEASSCTSSNRQPITSPPQVVQGGDGLVILFGTGKYFETGDNLTTSPTHSYYGIFDTGSVVSGRSALLEQSILAEVPSSVSGLSYDVRITTDHAVDYSAHDGWYIDFDSSDYTGERVVANSLVRSGRVIFPTLVPDTAACTYGGTSWLMEIDALSGSRLTVSPFDLNDDGSVNDTDAVRYDSNGDGVIDSNDDAVFVSGKKSNVGIIREPGVISKGDEELKYTSGSSGDIEVTTESSGDVLGRQSWLQVR